MKVQVTVIGAVRGPLREAVREYERRAGRYHALKTVEVRATRASSRTDHEVREDESGRLAAAIPAGYQAVALHRAGTRWTSRTLSRYLDDLGVRGEAGVAFVIGGALGLSESLLDMAQVRLSLSTMTLPHEMARLVLVEQIYRAGTISRGEPYHKGGG